MKDGPLKTAFESDPTGVLYQEFITYRIDKNGMLTKDVVTRTFKQGGDYYDTSSHRPFFNTKQYEVASKN
jgi:hypothetical protein